MNEPVNCTNSELSTFLQGLAEGYLPTYSSDTTQCALSRSNPIASKCYQHGKKTVTFHGFPSLMMCKHSTEHHGEDSLTLSQEASHAKTSVAQEKAQDLTESEAGYGSKCGESLAKYDLNTYSWKTHQLCLFEELEKSLEIWPKWGMMRNGECWALKVAVGQSNESGFGLPAPTKSMGKRGWGISNIKPRYSATLEANARLFGYKPHPSVLEWSMGWIPTWTRLAPLETDKFHKWLRSHGKF
jgi:hypothetical protein